MNFLIARSAVFNLLLIPITITNASVMIQFINDATIYHVMNHHHPHHLAYKIHKNIIKAISSRSYLSIV